MFWIVLAVQMSTVEAVRPLTWLSPTDLPVNDLPRSGIGPVFYRATVAPDGRIVRCEVEVTSGNEKLDQRTCDLLMRRARFTPARWSGGTSVYGVFRSMIIWSLNNSGSYFSPVDIELTVNKIPRKTAASPAKYKLMVGTDETGKPLSCAASNGKTNPTVVDVACPIVMQSYIAGPVKDEGGTPVRAVQDILVSFVRDK